ncbi:MAG: methionine ABC transporter ATP-binding protein, partial [Candidatus Adiutrix sp.]
AYPAQLSGGQKQRVGIARALANHPKVLLCDEATSALDPQTTKSILTLLKDIKERLGLTVVLITHEMKVITEICDRVAVMDDGLIVESGPVFEVFTKPQHPTSKTFVEEVIKRQGTHGIENYRPSGLLVRVLFLGPHAVEPIISRITKMFDVEPNILQGHIDQIQGLPFGIMILDLIGELSHCQKALDYMQSLNLSVKVLGATPTAH